MKMVWQIDIFYDVGQDGLPRVILFMVGQINTDGNQVIIC